MYSGVKRITAVMIKGALDIKTNWNLIITASFPLLFMLIISTLIPSGEKFPLETGLLMLPVIVGIMPTAYLLAEEKEKKTAEVLLVTPVTRTEVLLGNGILVFILIVLETFLMLAFDGSHLTNTVITVSAAALASVMCILIGMLIGTLSGSLRTTGVIEFPFILFFIMFPTFAIVTEGTRLVVTVTKFIPTYYYIKMLHIVYTGSPGADDLIPYFGVMVGSVLITFALLLIVLRKKFR